MLGRMQKVCFYHAGCPDGFGAVWSVWRAWGAESSYRPLGHDDEIDAATCEDALVVFVDIAPDNDPLRKLSEVASQVVVLDHHVSARDRYHSDLALANEIEDAGHQVLFDMEHSGSVLAWQYFHPDESVPDLLRYVQDQDLWHWKMPGSEEVNAAIASYPRTFEIWDELAARAPEELISEGRPILRSNQMEIERALTGATAIRIGTHRGEAVNATVNRAKLGHELAQRARYGEPWGCVYRVSSDRVSATLYSIGDFDVARIATGLGGGGHRNAAGFSVPLKRWLQEFV
jgi:oligoribonuclease NrnB/cAMP/cGMP phosphodiesterase (DHH superfamily)